MFCGSFFILRRIPPVDRIKVSKTVSRVLYLTVIYLDVLLPTRSSHPGSGRADLFAPIPVLLRIEFTAMDAFTPSGALLPRLSTLTSKCWRFLSVALFLKSPSAGVTRYSCPVEPGLSSWTSFRPAHATVCFTHLFILQDEPGLVNEKEREFWIKHREILERTGIQRKI